MSIAEIKGFREGKQPQATDGKAQAAMASIASIDLSMVRKKVLEQEGWTERLADYSELRYRRFLCMRVINPGLALVPTSDIDAFWHQHILFTRDYADDCRRVLGGFLHHSPPSGTDDEQKHLQQGFAATATFYAEIFGDDYAAVDPDGYATNWLAFFD